MTFAPRPIVGHLPHWARDPLGLLEHNAGRAEGVFELRLGVNAFVGHSPAWNRFVLGDLERFGSRHSFSKWVPYLAGGVILTDAPQHKVRRAELNPGFHPHALEHLRAVIGTALEPVLPTGSFDARDWAARVSLTALNASFFEGDFDPILLEDFLHPLHRAFPAPLLPRPRLFKRVDAELRRLLEARAAQPRHDLLSYLRRFDNPLEEARVSLAAGYDTTAHTLSWAAWHVAQQPRWTQDLGSAVKETLRLYPPGFVGSRRALETSSFEGRRIPKGSIVLYSPYLTHRSPAYFANPLEWTPERFESHPEAWTYLPFGAGERTCVGMHLANLVIGVALEGLFAQPVRAVRGDPAPRPGLTLAPRGALILERS